MVRKLADAGMARYRPSPLRSLGDAVAIRMRGPGGYYNLGNVIGFAVGTAQAAAVSRESDDAASAQAAVSEYLMGDPSAVALSLAMVIFFISGEVYFRAWRDAARPNLTLVRAGDALSAVAAAALCISLVLVGNAALGVASSVLLVGGKLGSACMPTASWILRVPGVPPFDPFRVAVVLSRFPALVAIAGGLVATLAADVPASGVLIQQATLLLCYSLWLRADLMLFRAR